ncbi:MAG: TatD family hydrolase [Gammaproteobacteria bacterium]|nr:TatD family hydrolase [Gammaproteobacteria bacterium]
MIIDSHCHIDFEVFDDDREQVLSRARALGIQTIVVPGISAATWPRVKAVCQQHPGLHPAYGLHPYFIDQHADADLVALDNWLHCEQAIAVGECGLDFYLKQLDKTKQLRFFEAQLDIAQHHHLPLVIHARKATEQVIQCLKSRTDLTGMMHSYSGSYEQAMQLIDLGFYLSFGGPVTYQKASRLRQLVSKLPVEALLVETDAPDQPDLKHHGLRNEPGYITNAIEQISQLKGISVPQLISVTSRNAQQLFSL